LGHLCERGLSVRLHEPSIFTTRNDPADVRVVRSSSRSPTSRRCHRAGVACPSAVASCPHIEEALLHLGAASVCRKERATLSRNSLNRASD
jgi:hypothetical protein